ncbi:MAG TPA: serine hydrolase domain-containing protein, partial [Chitinophagaceae bacterium]|nr:serine hydrolase domain-containing protein [Chitinophagaceae bacterium]
LALVIDRAAGMDHGTYIREQIIDKAGLQHTQYLPSVRRVPEVKAYLFNEESEEFDDVSEAQYLLTEGLIGDDGLVSTPEDLAHFYRTLFETNVLLQAASRNQMLQFAREKGQPKYGLGIAYRGDAGIGVAWGHSGSGLGASAEAVYLPRTKTVITLLTNAGTALEGPVAGQFEQLYDQIVNVMVRAD